METSSNDPRTNAPGEPARVDGHEPQGAQQFTWFDQKPPNAQEQSALDRNGGQPAPDAGQLVSGYPQYATEALIPRQPQPDADYREREYPAQLPAASFEEPATEGFGASSTQTFPERTAEGFAAPLAGSAVEDDPQQPPPAYTIPESPEAGWDMAPSRRRDWVSRGLLLCILFLQATLSLRLHNTAFEDEALYLYAGHMEIAHLLHGTPLPINYNSYFSGSPVLYPVAAAAVDAHFGLIGARALSLLFTLGTTTLLYATTRRMFNERAALVAAALFAVTESAIVLGHFATYDAAALFLLALATWIVVRTDRAPVVAVLLAAPVAVLAVAVKYASALYLPTIVMVAVLTAWPHRGWRSLWRGLLLCLGIGVIIVIGLKFTGVLAGVQQTTTNRAHGTESASSMLIKSRDWGGLLFATACAGAVLFARRGRMNESPLARGLSGPGRRWRTLLGLVLCGTALLAPAYQINLHTSVSLFKHIGFGLFFAAPMAGIGVTRMVGRHFRYPQLGILLWVVLLCMGIAQSDQRFAVWPDSTELVATLKSHVNEQGHYLGSAYEVPVYYLRNQTNQRQWASTFNITYQDKKGITHTGQDGYAAAIKAGWFDLVVLDGVTTAQTDTFIAGQLKASPRYRLLGTVPFTSGRGAYRIWVKTS